jgi:hypothetical protein
MDECDRREAEAYEAMLDRYAGDHTPTGEGQ